MATRAKQVMMRLDVRVDAPRTLVMTHVPQHAGLNKSLEVLVNGRQRNGRKVLFDPHINLFRRIVAGSGHQHFVNLVTLVSGRQAVLAHNCRNWL